MKRLRRTGGAEGIVSPNASLTRDEPGMRNSVITMQNFVTVSHTVCLHVKGPKKFSAHRIGKAAWLNLGNVLHFIYRAKLITVCQNIWASVWGSQKFWGTLCPTPLASGACLSPTNTPSHTGDTMANMVALGQTARASRPKNF